MTPIAPHNPSIDLDYTLDHKYSREQGRIYLSGVQALVRLPLMQQMRDRAAQLNTAGFISGYRGSPLGGFDLELWKAKKHLAESNIVFTPGLNEDLGATMVWGTQQTNLFDGAKVDGVFSMWYGKGPGVDRCGDVFKHGNAAGTSQFGGVLALAADDHACRSSTLPHGSELEFVSAMMPVLNPAGVQDILDMGLLGWAMSRFTGRWVGFKTIAETVESSASVNVNPHQLDIIIPEDFQMPSGGLNIRWPDPPRDPKMPILTGWLQFRILLVALVMLVGCFTLFHWEQQRGSGMAESRTVAVNLFVMVEMFYLFNCRSFTRSMFAIGLFSNPWVIFGSFSMITLQLSFTYLPAMNALFHSAPIDLDAWWRILAFAAFAYFLVGVEKLITNRMKKPKPVP